MPCASLKQAWCVLRLQGDYLPPVARSVDPEERHFQNKHKASPFGRFGFLLPFSALKQAWCALGQQKAPAMQRPLRLFWVGGEGLEPPTPSV